MSPTPQITVHHLENSRSQRVLWMLEELGQPYALRLYRRHPKTMRAPPELEQVHPLGRAPAVELDGEVLVESGAILEELAERFGQLRPAPGTAEHRRYRFWMHYAEGSVMSPLLVRLIMAQVKSAPLPFFIKPIARTIAGKVDENFTEPEIRRHFAYIERCLGESPWLAGADFSAADVQMSFPIEAGAARGGVDTPHILDWLARIHARPAYQRALERGGPYTIL